MANFLEDIVKIDTSSMTTEELEQLRDKLQTMVDSLTHKLNVRKMCKHKHQYSYSD